MSKIIVAPTGSIDIPTRKLISNKGYILIETDKWDQVRMLDASISINSNDMIMSALEGMQGSDGAMVRFVRALYERMKKNESKNIDIP